MEAMTGQIIEIDHAVTGRGYLNEKYIGGGVLTELLSNAGTLKSSLTTAIGDQVSVSLPAEGFLSVGDVVTVVKDDDSCELFYENHSKKRSWSSGRSPKPVRDLYRIAKFAINGGLFWAVLIGIPAGLARGQSPIMNLIALGCLTAAIVAGIWSLTARPSKISRHNKAAREMANQETQAQTTYIAEKEQRRLARLNAEVG